MLNVQHAAQHNETHGNSGLQFALLQDTHTSRSMIEMCDTNGCLPLAAVQYSTAHNRCAVQHSTVQYSRSSVAQGSTHLPTPITQLTCEGEGQE